MNTNYNQIINCRFIGFTNSFSVFSISTTNLKILGIALTAFAVLTGLIYVLYLKARLQIVHIQEASISAFKTVQQVFQHGLVTPMSEKKENPIELDEQAEEDFKLDLEEESEDLELDEQAEDFIQANLPLEE